jgi:hypothetical protein
MAYSWSTTPANVKTVISVSDGDDLTAYIDTAESVIAAHCLDSSYADSILELIHRWASAHFYACNRRRQVQAGVAGGPQVQYDPVPTDLYLNSTHYGQTAIGLDKDGNLAAYVNTLQEVKTQLPSGGSRVAWLGRPRGAF